MADAREGHGHLADQRGQVHTAPAEREGVSPSAAELPTTPTPARTPMLKMALPLPPSRLTRLRQQLVPTVLTNWIARRSTRRRARGETHPRLRKLFGSVITVFVLVALLSTQLNGAFGGWLADELRAILGPQATAQIESWFLGVQDTIHQAQYSISGAPSSAPWEPQASTPTQPLPPQVNAMPLPDITPLIQPPVHGEGVWSSAGLPSPQANQPPLVARAFVRPDPSRPYAVVTLLQFDLRYLTLHVAPGATEPGGPLGHDGSGAIPQRDQQGDALLAAFNGGFKYSDGHYGLMADGEVYVPPQDGAATIAITAKGQVLMDAWGRNPQVSSSNTNLVAWRQNGALLLDNGQLNPLTSDGKAWGGVWLNKAATWRSGIGLSDHNTLIYAAGDSLTAATLGTALQSAGAVMAMQTDINPEWVRAFVYDRDAGGALHITKLDPGMQGSGKEYLQRDARDFFYITRTASNVNAN